MKVKQFADEKGISRQAVYSAISKKGYEISQLTDSAGNLTETGLATLEELFKGSSGNKRNDNLQKRIKELEKTVSEQQKTIESKNKTIDEQSAVILSLTESVDRLSKMADRESVNVSQAQQLQLAAMLKISREPLLKRLFSGKKEEQ